jgi:hypothetical protein
MRRGLPIGLLWLTGCGFAPPPFIPLAPEEDSADRRGRVLVDSYVCWVWSGYPAEATAAGIHEYDHTFGERSPSAARAREETLRYYLDEVEEALRVAPSQEVRLDLEASRMDIHLRMLRGPPPEWVAMGIWALLYAPTVADSDRARWLAGRLSKFPSLGGDAERAGNLAPLIQAAREWFGTLEESELREAGVRAAESARDRLEAMRTGDRPLPLGESRMRELISILLHGVPDGRVDLKKLDARARSWMGEGPVGESHGGIVDFSRHVAEVQALAAELVPLPDVDLSTTGDSWWIRGLLIGPEPFSRGPARASYLPRNRSGEEDWLDAASELYPGRLTYRAYARARASDARRMARNAALEHGVALLASRVAAKRMLARRPELWRAQHRLETIAACRLVVAIGYHSGRLGWEEAVHLFRARAGLDEEEAGRETWRAGTDPESATAAIGSRYLHSLLEKTTWEAVLSAGHAPLDALWSALTGTAPPADPFAGPASGNY